MIRSDLELRAHLARIDKLMDALPGTPDGDELLELVARVEAYESVRFPIEPPSEEDVRNFRREQIDSGVR